MDHLNIISRGKKIDWVELIVHFTGSGFAEKSRIENWLNIFADVTIVSPDSKKPSWMPPQVQYKTSGSEENRSEIWNRLAAASKKQWVLFLEDDEEINPAYFPAEKLVNPKKWIPALILQQAGESNFKQYYQIRLVPNSTVFDGKNLPDATRFISQNNIELSDNPIRLNRDTDPFLNIDPDDEMSERNFSPQLYLISGNRLLHQRKYVYAAAQFRQLIKMDTLLPFDRLAALNGLASCYTEQYKWPQALKSAQDSIDVESFQRIPYLIQFKIFELNKRWQDAFDILKKYHDILSAHSKANFDKFISEKETILTLGNLAQKAGLRQEALTYFEKLYALQNGKVEKSLLHTLLVLSIELEDCQKAVFYFKQIFEKQIPDQLNEEKIQQLNDYLSMFMVNGWYDYPSKVYDLLYEQESENNEYRRRLIVTLSKTNRLDKARRLIAINL